MEPDLSKKSHFPFFSPQKNLLFIARKTWNMQHINRHCRIWAAAFIRMPGFITQEQPLHSLQPSQWLSSQPLSCPGCVFIKKSAGFDGSYFCEEIRFEKKSIEFPGLIFFIVSFAQSYYCALKDRRKHY